MFYNCLDVSTPRAVPDRNLAEAPSSTSFFQVEKFSSETSIDSVDFFLTYKTESQGGSNELRDIRIK